MNTQEACDILGIKTGDSKEIADKAFRKLAAKYHPDKVSGNKEAAEAKFKKISEAYQLIKERGTSPASGFRNGPTEEEIQEMFRNAGFRVHHQTIRPRVLVGSVDVSFIESITGCRKPVSFTRQMKCSNCNGNRCATCSNTGIVSELKETDIDLPPGVEDRSYARIEGEGGFVQGHMADAILEIHVEKDNDMTRVGMDVISNITISLLEALKGTSKETKTAYGNKTLKIKPGIKNGDTVGVRGFGVGRSGSHIFKIRVDYPNELEHLINLLENYPKDKLEEIEGE